MDDSSSENGNSNLFERQFNFPELLDFDRYMELCSSSIEPSLLSPVLSTLPIPMLAVPSFSLVQSNSMEQNTSIYPESDQISHENAVEICSGLDCQPEFLQSSEQLVISSDFVDLGGVDIFPSRNIEAKYTPYLSNDDNSEPNKIDIIDSSSNSFQTTSTQLDFLSNPLNHVQGISSWSGGCSLTERILKALSLFKESSKGVILAQVWRPIKLGDEYILSTSDQPYLLDQMLAGYREVSRTFTFSLKETPDSFPGLPGRVFMSRMPEWTSNVIYYSKVEYLRANHALNHEVRGSLAVPIFNSQDQSCCAVLELITRTEKTNFDPEMENVCKALQAVNLRTHETGIPPQELTKNQRAAISEIAEILRIVCESHTLPLALMWVTVSDPTVDHSTVSSQPTPHRETNTRKRTFLRVQKSACYLNDKQMQGFLHACLDYYLESGKGVAGKALESNHPFFSPDVKSYNISEYPLAHHARKFGLNAAVAIKLRSTYTGNYDYILEFFLPVNCKDNSELNVLLNNLSNTMQRLSRSLRTVSESELCEIENAKINVQGESEIAFTSEEIAEKSPVSLNDSLNNDLNTMVSIQSQKMKKKEEIHHEKEAETGPRKQIGKKRNSGEKTISISVLQQYFSGSLKNAAKSLGVCPTTLKRICRQHGISRWPSRKINKVNRSLRKIQNVIDSVQGVEAALRFDPIAGGLIATTSRGPQAQNDDNHKNTDVKNKNKTNQNLPSPFKNLPLLSEPTNPMQVNAQSHLNVCDYKKNLEGGVHPNSLCIKENFLEVIDHDGVDEHNQPSSSVMTDSSNTSDSISPTSQNRDKTKGFQFTGDTVTVKATYKENTARFKYVPTMGCSQLFEEVGKRFRLPTDNFQLKYLDDEDEWVMLVNDDDLHECVEILESIGSRCIKLLVRDFPYTLGSSSSIYFP